MALCDYYGCNNSCPEDQMEVFSDWTGVKWLACPEHAGLVQNSSGYCGMNCQFGYGCDHSC